MIPQLLQFLRIFGSQVGARSALGAASSASRIPMIMGGIGTTIGIITLPITYPIISGFQYIGDQLDDTEEKRQERAWENLSMRDRAIEMELRREREKSREEKESK